MAKQGEWMAKQDQHQAEHTPSSAENATESGSVHNLATDTNQQTPSNNTVLQQDTGRKFTFDNLDYRQNVHYMTEEHQNIDNHCVTYMATENRVSGNHLSNQAPEHGILQMENGLCLPSPYENAKQRENYITLAERVISTNVPCMEFLAGACTPHIPHGYSKEMNEKTKTVSEHHLQKYGIIL